MACPSASSSDGTLSGETTDYPAVDLFRAAEKRYRYRPPAPNRKARRQRQHLQHLKEGGDNDDDLSDVIDLHHLDLMPPHLFSRIHPHPLPPPTSPSSSPLSPHARIYTLDGCPGLYLIPHALSPSDQSLWSHRCLSSYSTAAHTNLTNLHGPQADHWRDAVASGDWAAFDRLRWASLGFHYDWTVRSYTASRYSPFPPALADLSSSIAAALHLPLHPSAALVNFYPLSSSMLAHVDDAELTHTPPIVSISLGQSAVFLMGGRTKTTAPTAVMLHSGDVVVMSGESRRCYHGVPRIVAGRVWEEGGEGLEGVEEGEVRRVREYLSEHRINLNVRQVEDEQHTFAAATHAAAISTTSV